MLLKYFYDETLAQASGAAPERALQAWMEYLVSGGARPPLPEGPSVALDGSTTMPPSEATRPGPTPLRQSP